MRAVARQLGDEGQLLKRQLANRLVTISHTHTRLVRCDSQVDQFGANAHTRWGGVVRVDGLLAQQSILFRNGVRQFGPKVAETGGLEVVVYANAFRGTTSAWLASVGRPDCCAGLGALHDAADYDDDGVMTPGAYAARCVAWRDAGATVIGGCCGVTPSHVRAVRDALADEAIVVKLPT